MSTPFDDITWKLRDTGLNPPPICQLPEPDKDIKNCSQPVYSGTDSIHTSPYPEHHPPLRSYTHFMINFTECGSITVDFKDAPLYMKDIWDAAQNVYYDEEFYAIRGDLMYNRITGEQSNSFGSHFIITYDGRKGTGGCVKHLSFCLVDEDAIAIPTKVLAHMCGNRGGWVADTH